MKRILFIIITMYLSLNLIQGQTISVEDRVYGISKFWQEANYNFAYFENIPNTDFDSLYKSYLHEIIIETNDYKYYRILERFCAELKDGHTNIYMPKYLRDSIFYPPIRIRKIENETYIINVGTSYVEEIPIGSKIIKVNDENVSDYLENEVYPYLTGADHIVENLGTKTMLEGLKGQNLSITIEKPNGVIENVNVKMDGKSEEWHYPIISNQSNEIVRFKQLEDSIGYIQITTFADSKVVDEFKKLIPILSTQNAIIIDLRQNGGGSSRYAHEITKYFTDKKYFYGEQGSTRKHLASHKAWGAFNDEEYTKRLGLKVYENDYLDYYNDNVWKLEKNDSIVNDIVGEKLLMPLVILISNNTASAAEDFLIGMSYLKRATFIGQKTFGSTGQPIFFPLPNEGAFRICTRKCTYPDGKKFVGIGIIPDIEIEPNLSYYISDKDIVLKKATDYLINKKNSR